MYPGLAKALVLVIRYHIACFSNPRINIKLRYNHTSQKCPKISLFWGRVITKNSRENFRYECVAYANKLGFQEHNTLHYHLLLWCDSGILEDLNEVGRIISAELPRPRDNDELSQLIKNFMMHLHSPYCTRPTSSAHHCRFCFDDGGIIPLMYMYLCVNLVVYGRRKEGYMNVVA